MGRTSYADRNIDDLLLLAVRQPEHVAGLQVDDRGGVAGPVAQLELVKMPSEPMEVEDSETPVLTPFSSVTSVVTEVVVVDSLLAEQPPRPSARMPARPAATASLPFVVQLRGLIHFCQGGFFCQKGSNPF